MKDCRAAAEMSRVAIRNARRDAKGKLERAKKEGEISEDDMRRAEDQLQKLTDEYVKKADGMLAVKEAEVMEI